MDIRELFKNKQKQKVQKDKKEFSEVDATPTSANFQQEKK
jgi:hypothetical protein